MIAFGDYNQLNPVGDVPIYRNATNNPLSILADNPLWHLFHSYRLTEIMRQRDDKQFAEILSKIGDGELNESEIAILRKWEEIPLPTNRKILHLCRTNAEVDLFNETAIADLPFITVTATDIIPDNIFSTTHKDYLLSQIQLLPIDKTHGLPKTWPA